MKRLLMCLLILVGFGLAGCEEGEHEHHAHGHGGYPPPYAHEYPRDGHPYGYPRDGYPHGYPHNGHPGYDFSDTTSQSNGVSQFDATVQP
jgi:hypothetical protein